MHTENAFHGVKSIKGITCNAERIVNDNRHCRIDEIKIIS